MNNPLSFMDPSGLANDCAGPCTPFSYAGDFGCTVTVTYYQDYAGYDMPIFTTTCPGGGGSTYGGGPNGQTGGGASGSGQPVNAIAAQISKENSCMAGSQAAMNAQPSVAPTAQNALDGAMGGVIALVTSLWGLPEDAPMLPLAYKTLTGVGTGVARRSLSHAVQKGFVYLTSYHSCLAASGLAAPYNPYAPS